MPDYAGDRLQVPPELELAGAKLNTMATTIGDHLNDLKTQLVPLEASWTGDAQPHYQYLQAAWNTAAHGLFGVDGVLGEIASAVNLAWNNYSECEWANVRTWRG